MPEPGRVARLIEKIRRLTADETGYLGMPDGSVQGTAEADGYIYDIPYKPGFTYVRILNGVETEPGEALAGGIPHNPNRRVGFQRFGGVLLAMGVNPLSSASGGDVGADYIPPHALGDHTDVDAATGSTGDVLTQQSDGTFAFEPPAGGSTEDVQSDNSGTTKTIAHLS